MTTFAGNSTQETQVRKKVLSPISYILYQRLIGKAIRRHAFLTKFLTVYGMWATYCCALSKKKTIRKNVLNW